MAKKKTSEEKLQRTYNIPLRKEWLKAPKYRRAKKAMTALKQFVMKHMKAEKVKIGPFLNKHIWRHGIKNPPHHVKVDVLKKKDFVLVEMQGKTLDFAKTKEDKEKKKKAKSKKEALMDKLAGKKEEKKEEKAEALKEKLDKAKKEKKETKEEKPKEEKTEVKAEKKEEVKEKKEVKTEKAEKKEEPKKEEKTEEKKEAPKEEHKKEEKK